MNEYPFSETVTAPELSPDPLSDTPAIDPHDPFSNETEFHHYTPDYGYIVPQIRIPGCRIPLLPNHAEKARIRHYFGLVGFGLLAHMLISNLLASLFVFLYSSIQTLIDTARLGELPENYSILLDEYFAGTSSMTALNIIVFMTANVLVALLGCKLSKVPIASLFQTRQLTVPTLLSYIAIAIGVQQLCAYLTMWVTDIFASSGYSVYTPDFSVEPEIKSIVLSFIYGCIVAPVTEELLFRGFILKNLSRVSQRFGIVCSAILFGLWHENLPQFILAFCMGIFMGYLTVKHNSLVPAIVAHMAVNTAGELFDIFWTMEWYTAYSVLDICYMAVFVIGCILLLRLYLLERLPYTTPHQAERGWRVAFTSFPLMLAMGCYLFYTILLILEENGFLDTVRQNVESFLQQ